MRLSTFEEKQAELVSELSKTGLTVDDLRYALKLGLVLGPFSLSVFSVAPWQPWELVKAGRGYYLVVGPFRVALERF